MHHVKVMFSDDIASAFGAPCSKFADMFVIRS